MRSGASTIGRPHCAGCQHIHICSTPVHQERIILAAHSFDTSVAHTHLQRTTPAHPEPARVETATCPLDGRFHSTDRPRSQEDRSMGPCGVHVQRMTLRPSMERLERLDRPSRPRIAILGGARLGKKLVNVIIWQENVKISLCRAKLGTEGVSRVPTL